MIIFVYTVILIGKHRNLRKEERHPFAVVGPTENNFGLEGVKVLGDALKTHTTMKWLWLGGEAMKQST